MADIARVGNEADVATVAGLAVEIWNEHFAAIIGQGQVDYMLGKFQSVDAIGGQIAAGYEYYLVRIEDGPAGYFALVPDGQAGEVMLSKIYLLKRCRGLGIGKEIMAFCQRRCRDLGAKRLWLTVNKGNAGPIAFYKRMGFEIGAEMVTDIGGGYVMDDYKMVLRVRRD